jgi:ATP-dependent DNA ligase|tara:strand:- start:140 stop:1450 length:1311 start_codon:yes stop_codon:yes gene_type:complete
LTRTELFQLHSTGRLKHLTIEVQDDVIVREWWTSKDGTDGKKQVTREKIHGKNPGRSNETTGAEQALLKCERKIRKKMEEGYVKSREEALVGARLDIEQMLSQSFAPCKPINKLPDSADPYDGTWLAERKMNGVCILLHNTGSELIAYSRRMKPITDIVSVVPDIVFCLERVPSRSLIIGELVTLRSDGIEDAKSLKGVTTATTTVEKAQGKYDALNAEGYVFDYYVFDVIFWKGEDLTSRPFTERLAVTNEFVGTGGVGDARKVETLTRKMYDEAREKGWEGYILRRGDDTITYTMNGKPKRKGAYKFKFIWTADCIVTEVCPGSGKHNQWFARFRLAQYENGTMVDCGWAGPGRLGEKGLGEITDELLGSGYSRWEAGSRDPIILDEKDWFAVELEYQSRQARNDKGQLCFEFPVITRTREDKPLGECEVDDPK